MPKTRSHDDYTVGWICALPLEMAAAKARLDEVHPPLAQPRHDCNSYALGAISGHNIAIACLPSGIYGTTSAAIVADQMQSTFHSIRFGLLVGIGGGVPSQADIRLGDIVVSKPTGTLPGIVQYDYGKTMTSGHLKRTGTQNLPPHKLLTAMAQVESNHMIGKCDLKVYLEDIISPDKNSEDSIFQYPGKENDELFNASYDHESSLPDCSNCDRSQLVQRKERSFTTPEVHYGTIASGNQVMKDGRTRDNLAQELGILCFEMEAAGLMNHFPCLVIRGICDYSDSHKNKDWQGYAAITAAVYAKELLSQVPLKQLSNGQSSSVQKHMGDFDVRFSTIDIPRIPYFVGREQELEDITKMLQDESSNGSVVLQGLPGIGKTQLAIAYILQHRHEYSGVFWLDATDPTTLESSFVRMAQRISLDHPSESFIKALIDANDMEQLEQMNSWDKMKLVAHRFPKGRSRKTPDDQELSDIVYAMIMWLSKSMNNRWLIVYDNYDAGNWPGSGESRDRIKAFLPDSQQGHVLITTRISDICTGHLIRVKKIHTEHGLHILSHTSGRQDITDDPHATELVKEMDGLPLALATAGKYMEQVAITCCDYLELYRNEWTRIQETGPRLPSYDRTLYSNWSLTLAEITHKNKLSRDILLIWTYLDSQDLWRELLQGVPTPLPLGSLGNDPIAFNEAMRLLLNYGLVEIGPIPRNGKDDSRGYSMHRCVHSWLSDNLEPAIRIRDPANVALFSVGLYAQRSLREGDRTRYARLLPHINRCLDLISQGVMAHDKANPFFIDCLILLGHVHCQAGLWISRPRKTYLHALAARVRHPRVGNLAKAETLFRMALERLERADPASHPDYYMKKATALCALADICRERCDFTKVLQISRLELQAYEATIDRDEATYQFCRWDVIFNRYYLATIRLLIAFGPFMLAEFLYMIFQDSTPLRTNLLFLAIAFGFCLSFIAFVAHWTQRWKTILLLIALILCAELLGAFHWGNPMGIHSYVGLIMTLFFMIPVIFDKGIDWRASKYP